MSDRTRGDSISVVVMRAGQRMTLHATLDTEPGPTWPSFRDFDFDFDVPSMPRMHGDADLERMLEDVRERLKKLERRLGDLDRT
jgi:hypothetical protein